MPYGDKKSYSFFKMKSSPAKYYQELELFKKYKKAKDVVKLGAKVGVRGALGIGGAAAGLLYDLGKRSIQRKKEGKSGFNLPKSKKNKGFNF